MWVMDYRLVIYGKQIYQEVVLSEDREETVRIGTGKICTVRFNREAFFDDFEIVLVRKEGQWHLTCGKNVFVMTGNELRQYVVSLKYGDSLSLHYEKSGVRFLNIEFLMDVKETPEDFKQYVDISEVRELSIGGDSQCMITLKDQLFRYESVFLRKSSDGLWMGRVTGTYGLYINGERQTEQEIMVHDGDFFSLGQSRFYLRSGKLYLGNQDTVRTGLPVCTQKDSVNHLEYPRFRLSTREQYVMPAEQPEICMVKQKTKPPKKNLLLTLVPAVISILLMILLRGVMGGGGTFVLYGVSMMTVGAVMSVVHYKNSGKEYAREQAERESAYHQYLDQKEQEIAALREKEKEILNLNYPTLERDIQFVQDFDRRLFERRRDDRDFLHVYLGRGELESACPVKYRSPEQKDTEDPLTELPGKLAEKYKILTDVPITINLAGINAAGMTGRRERLYEMVKNMSLDLAIRQFFQDVKLFYLLNEQDIRQFSWVRWLKNTWNETNGRRNFFYDEESRKNGLERLYNSLSYRENCSKEQLASMPALVIFVYRSEEFLTHPVSEYVKKAGSLGAVFIFCEEYPELLPQGCDFLIHLSQNEAEGVLCEAKNVQCRHRFRYSAITDKQAGDTARRLGCVYIEEVNLESSLTSKISLYSLLGILHTGDLDLSTLWSESRIYETMAAPVGVRSGNETVYLDIHEKAHGPHGLIAGTTGSGKSEILQTYILSMAILYHPYEVSFVIIDFKGGGMVNQFRRLPHLIGAITNIDGREINRSLLSIRAELQKRQELFAKYEVNHIDAYIRKYKEGITKTALPHLILIVDEFAELKTDHPDFMKELISTARIGRSLGVHLILATQKPSGVVDNQIWSNSRFRLCLKVQNREDSNEVLKSSLAAEIREPGRAYFQVGNNEIFELFQSAYSGAPVESDSMGRQREYRICTIDPAGRRNVIFEQNSRKKEETKTQLEAIVNHISDYCERKGIRKLPDICMMPLPDQVEYAGRTEEKHEEFVIQADIGICDDPSRQRQDVVPVVFTQQNLFVLGASGYGKTNLIQHMVKETAKQYSPEQVQIYIVDFASMILKSFEGLRHVGGVVTAYEDEKLKNLIKMLLEEMDLRREKLSKMGLSSYYSYLEGGYKGIPQILLIVENLTGFRELYPQYDEPFLRICREGISGGISVIVTNVQSSGVSYRYFSNFSRRIALYCHNSSEYYALFDRCRIEPKDMPGRGLIEVDRVIYEIQTYLAFSGEREIERAEAVKQFVMQMNEKYQGSRAKRIPEIPRILTEDALEMRILPDERGPYKIPYGLNYATTEAEWIDLASLSFMGICSPRRLGRRNFVNYVLRKLLQNQKEEPAECYIADGIDRAFGVWKQSVLTVGYSLNPDDVRSWLQAADEKLHSRYERLMAGDEEFLIREPLILFLLHGRDWASSVAADKQSMEYFRRITGKYKTLKVCVIFSDVENAAIGYNAPEPLKILKESRNYLIFEDLSEQKLCDIPVARAREFKKALEPGDAYRILGSSLIKVKTVLCKGGAENGREAED